MATLFPKDKSKKPFARYEGISGELITAENTSKLPNYLRQDKLYGGYPKIDEKDKYKLAGDRKEYDNPIPKAVREKWKPYADK